jgi:hypothetical protein
MKCRWCGKDIRRFQDYWTHCNSSDHEDCIGPSAGPITDDLEEFRYAEGN